MGSTMPVVPQNGDAARDAQPGIEGPLHHLPAGDGNDHLHAAGGPLKASATAASIICRGTWLMAAAPTG